MRTLFLCLLSVAACLSSAGAQAADNGFTQQDLVDATVARFDLSPVAAGRVFFLGFAGYGEERVFAEEIKLAAARVGERFGSSGRTLLLLNDRRDLATHPFATHASLRYSLAALRRVMDPERDVLFLALSSHGAENAMLEISNTDLPAVGLSASTLARMLEESGIRSRVIVISACYSGSFVELLASNETIVITAAAKDRTSFGCSDERHLTYFGEAFYRDALPTASDLRTAFAAARRDIRRREKEERVRHSQPQAHFGPLVEGRLAEIAAQAR